MKIYYLTDEGKKQSLNAQNRDYSPAYISCILNWIGVSGEECPEGQLKPLSSEDILIQYSASPDCIRTGAGVVIRFMTEPAVRIQKIFAHLIYSSSTTGEYRIPLFVPVEENAPEGEVLLYAEISDGRKIPAVIKRETNRITEYSFMFDLPGSVWYSSDGFSDGEGKNGFFIGRVPDTRSIPTEHDDSEPYNELLMGIVEDIIRSKGMITLDRLPPLKTSEKGEIIPDFLLHFSGDDDCTSSFYNINAAEVMNTLGFPYHLNVMPGRDRFVIDSGDVKKLSVLGCEIALHSDFTVQPYSAEGQKASCDLFEKNFGFSPLTNTNHCFIQSSMNAERLRWLGECRVIADNSKFGEFYPNDINAFNLCGFAFGFSFPRYTLDDAEHSNAPLSCMEIPINYYEPRLDLSYIDEKSCRYSDSEKIIRYLDRAAQEGRIAQFFIHPHYLAQDSRDMPAVVAVLRLILKHCGDNGYTPLFTTTNSIAKFWQSRAMAKLEYNDGKWIIDTPIPISIRLPLSYNNIEVIFDGESAVVIKKNRSGREDNFISVESGRHTLIINS